MSLLPLALQPPLSPFPSPSNTAAATTTTTSSPPLSFPPLRAANARNAEAMAAGENLNSFMNRLFQSKDPLLAKMLRNISQHDVRMRLAAASHLLPASHFCSLLRAYACVRANVGGNIFGRHDVARACPAPPPPATPRPRTRGSTCGL